MFALVEFTCPQVPQTHEVRGTLLNWFSPFTTWVQGIKLWSSGLAASNLTHWSITYSQPCRPPSTEEWLLLEWSQWVFFIRWWSCVLNRLAVSSLIWLHWILSSMQLWLFIVCTVSCIRLLRRDNTFYTQLRGIHVSYGTLIYKLCSKGSSVFFLSRHVQKDSDITLWCVPVGAQGLLV